MSTVHWRPDTGHRTLDTGHWILDTGHCTYNDTYRNMVRAMLTVSGSLGAANPL